MNFIWIDFSFYNIFCLVIIYVPITNYYLYTNLNSEHNNFFLVHVKLCPLLKFLKKKIKIYERIVYCCIFIRVALFKIVLIIFSSYKLPYNKTFWTFTKISFKISPTYKLKFHLIWLTSRNWTETSEFINNPNHLCFFFLIPVK